MSITSLSLGKRRKSRKPKRSLSAEVLLAVVADVARHAAFSELEEDLAGPMILAFRRFGVRYAPEFWLGRPSAAVRQSCSRAVRHLTQQGLLERVTEPVRDRVRFVRPTAAGLERAIELAREALDRVAIAQGLSQTLWGSELLQVLSNREGSGTDRATEQAVEIDWQDIE